MHCHACMGRTGVFTLHSFCSSFPLLFFFHPLVSIQNCLLTFVLPLFSSFKIGTIIACYLVSKGHMSAMEAVELTRKKRYTALTFFYIILLSFFLSPLLVSYGAIGQDQSSSLRKIS